MSINITPSDHEIDMHIDEFIQNCKGGFAGKPRRTKISLRRPGNNRLKNLLRAWISQPTQINPENLLSSLQATQEELWPITRQMRQVENLAKDAAESGH